MAISLNLQTFSSAWSSPTLIPSSDCFRLVIAFFSSRISLWLFSIIRLCWYSYFAVHCSFIVSWDPVSSRALLFSTELCAFEGTVSSPSLYGMASYRGRLSQSSLAEDSQGPSNPWGECVWVCNLLMRQVCWFLSPECVVFCSLWRLAAVLQVLWSWDR